MDQGIEFASEEKVGSILSFWIGIEK